MSARQSPRRGTPQRQTRGHMTSTPLERGGSPEPSSQVENGSPERPLSPGLIARDDEKKHLTVLNNRLARYIDHVNRLQNENQKLLHSVRRVEEQKSSEVSSVKNDFEREIAGLRSLLNAEAQQRAQAVADCDNYAKQVERLRALNATLQGDFDRAARQREELEKENADLRARVDNLKVQLSQQHKEISQLKKQLEDTERLQKAAAVEAATLRAKLDGMREENRFLKETYEKELQLARMVTEEEITEIDGRAQARADVLFEEKIEEFRRVYEIEKSDLRRRFDIELEQRLAGYVPAGDYGQMECRLETLSKELQVCRSDLEERKRLLDQERAWCSQQLRIKDGQIAEANARYRELKKEFDDLLDIRDGLQKELDTYETLLGQEESRLNLSGQSSSHSQAGGSSFSSSHLSSSGRKRKRLSSAFESTEGHEDIQCIYQNHGPLRVAEHDALYGKFVILENTSEEDIALGGWKLVHRSGGVEASHRFPPRFKIKANSKITIWSSDSGATHSPPSDILLKNISFPPPDSQTGDLEVTTALFNQDEEEMAKRVSRQKRASSTTVRKYTSVGRGTPQRVVSFAPSEVFHATGDDGSAAMDDSRCAIM